MHINKAFYPLWISFKFIAHSTKTKYTKVITVTTIMGITLAISTLLVVLSIMNGFSDIAKTRIVNLLPHISINLNQDYDDVLTEDEKIPLKNYATSNKLNSLMRITSNTIEKKKSSFIYPAFFTRGFIINNQRLLPIYISAVPTEVLKSKLENLKSKQLPDLATNNPTGKYLRGIILSSNIIQQLENSTSVSFATTNNIFKFYNTDILTDFSASDPLMSNIALMDINYAAELFPNANLNNINITLLNPNNAPQLARQLQREMTMTITNWTQFIGNYFKVLEYTKQIMFVLLSCIIVVAMFNAIATLTTILNEKQTEIAILKTMGGNSSLITNIFFIYGFTITTIGLIFGLVFGIILSHNISSLAEILEGFLGYKFINPEMYFIDFLPSKILSADIFNIVAFIYIVMTIAMIYPLRKAYKILPVNALRVT